VLTWNLYDIVKYPFLFMFLASCPEFVDATWCACSWWNTIRFSINWMLKLAKEVALKFMKLIKFLLLFCCWTFLHLPSTIPLHFYCIVTLYSVMMWKHNVCFGSKKVICFNKTISNCNMYVVLRGFSYYTLFQLRRRNWNVGNFAYITLWAYCYPSQLKLLLMQHTNPVISTQRSIN
jgi:hypothetical protein